MSSSMEIFTKNCANFVRSTILSEVVKYLKNKGVEVTVEELAAHLELPVKTSPSITNIVNSVQTTGGKTGLTEIEPGKCAYKFKRGPNVGKFCGNPTPVDDIFCKKCRTTRNVQDPAPEKKNILNTPNYKSAFEKRATPELAQLNFTVFDNKRSLYRDRDTGGILKELEDGKTYVVIGTCVHNKFSDKANILPLSPELADFYKERGIVYKPLTAKPSIPPISLKHDVIPKIPSFINTNQKAPVPPVVPIISRQVGVKTPFVTEDDDDDDEEEFEGEQEED